MGHNDGRDMHAISVHLWQVFSVGFLRRRGVASCLLLSETGVAVTYGENWENARNMKRGKNRGMREEIKLIGFSFVV